MMTVVSACGEVMLTANTIWRACLVLPSRSSAVRVPWPLRPRPWLIESPTSPRAEMLRCAAGRRSWRPASARKRETVLPTWIRYRAAAALRWSTACWTTAPATRARIADRIVNSHHGRQGRGAPAARAGPAGPGDPVLVRTPETSLVMKPSLRWFRVPDPGAAGMAVAEARMPGRPGRGHHVYVRATFWPG